jgi:hypothetical protein
MNYNFAALTLTLRDAGPLALSSTGVGAAAFFV